MLWRGGRGPAGNANINGHGGVSAKTPDHKALYLSQKGTTHERRPNRKTAKRKSSNLNTRKFSDPKHVNSSIFPRACSHEVTTSTTQKSMSNAREETPMTTRADVHGS